MLQKIIASQKTNTSHNRMRSFVQKWHAIIAMPSVEIVDAEYTVIIVGLSGKVGANYRHGTQRGLGPQ